MNIKTKLPDLIESPATKAENKKATNSNLHLLILILISQVKYKARRGGKVSTQKLNSKRQAHSPLLSFRERDRERVRKERDRERETERERGGEREAERESENRKRERER